MTKEYAPLEPLGWPGGPPINDVVATFHGQYYISPNDRDSHEGPGHLWDADWICERCGGGILEPIGDECLG